MEITVALGLFAAMVAAWVVMPASSVAKVSEPTQLPTRGTADDLRLTA
ncbi:MAG: hypothetical protein ABR591_14770 [Candidatus Velthaea sp.]